MKTKVLVVIVLIQLLIIISLAGYILVSVFKVTDTSYPSETEYLIAQVSRHMMIDTTVAPTIATITDIETIKGNNPKFYENAENGDKLLIFQDQAILYSVKKDLILKVAAIEEGTTGN